MNNKLFLVKYKLAGEDNSFAKLILQDCSSGVTNKNNNILEHEFGVHKDDITFIQLVDVDGLYRNIYKVKRSDYKSFLVKQTDFDNIDEDFYIETNEESPINIERLLDNLGENSDFYKYFNKNDFVVYLEGFQKEIEQLKSTQGLELYKRKSFTKKHNRR